MSKTALSVFIPSYNKHGFCAEAIQSVLSQDFTGYELWILENSTDDQTRDIVRDLIAAATPGQAERVRYEEIEVPESTRQGVYVTPWLLNQYYGRANGEVILYLSDDDLFTQGTFGRVAAWFEENPDKSVMYFGLRITEARAPGEGHDAPVVGAIDARVTRGTGGETHLVDCHIDGGQIAHRKSALDAIGHPWFHEGRDERANHCDGVFMSRLAGAHTFWPLDFHGVTHRRTPISNWTAI